MNQKEEIKRLVAAAAEDAKRLAAEAEMAKMEDQLKRKLLQIRDGREPQ